MIIFMIALNRLKLSRFFKSPTGDDKGCNGPSGRVGPVKERSNADQEIRGSNPTLA